MLDLPDMDPEGAELAGPVLEGPAEVVGHVEHERPGLLGLLHDLLDGKGVVAVPPDDGLALGHAGRPATRGRALPSWKSIVALYENLILTKGARPLTAPPRPIAPVGPFATVRNLALSGNSIAPGR